MSTGPTPCPNCSLALPEPQPRFCPSCGQETRVLPPTLREFAQQFGGAYFSTEGALWRTLKLLLLKPGELTKQYLAGRRKHYVLPLRLYLTISVVMLLLLRVLGPGDVVRIDATVDDADLNKPPSFSVLGLGEEGKGIGVKDGVFYCNTVPQWSCKRVQRFVSSDPKVLAAAMEEFNHRLVGNLGGAVFMLLPTFALGLKLVYRSRRMRYTEHLVFALHVHAFWFLALGLILTKLWWLKAIGFTAVPLYSMLAMRRVYGGRRWPRVLRALVVSFLYLLALGVALGVVGLWTLVV